MRAYIRFMHREGWSFHLLAEDCLDYADQVKSLVVAGGGVARDDLAKMHGDVAEAQRKILGDGAVGVWVELSAAQCEFFGISRLY